MSGHGPPALALSPHLWALLATSLVHTRLGLLCMVASGVPGTSFSLGPGKFPEWSLSEAGWTVSPQTNHRGQGVECDSGGLGSGTSSEPGVALGSSSPKENLGAVIETSRSGCGTSKVFRAHRPAGQHLLGCFSPVGPVFLPP